MNIRAYGLFIELDLVHECYAKIGCLPSFERSLVNTRHYFTIRFKYWREISISHFFKSFILFQSDEFIIWLIFLILNVTLFKSHDKKLFYLRELFYSIMSTKNDKNWILHIIERCSHSVNS